MQENTNKAIAYNTVILYVRLIVTAVCALFTTRFALQALGVTDFGLFSVLGSIISFIAIINTIMLSTSNRFIAVAIGKGNIDEANKAFCVNVAIHVSIAIITLLLALLVGEWYIHRFVNYAGDINAAVSVFKISIIGSVISFIGVPYNGLLMARERFSVFCLTDIILHVLKLSAVYALVYYFEEKLLWYATIVAITSALPTLVYILYCSAKYTAITKWRFVKETSRYKEVLGFSAWVAYGAIANIGKTQGAALLVNAFFSTIMNTALGIANTVNALIMNFAQNVTKPIAPQITKNYSAGNIERCNQLMIMTSKFSFLTMLVISAPFLVETEYILQLWLGEVPDYAVIFTRLIVIDALLGSLNAGVSEIIFASGKIKMYQILVNTIWLFSILAGYIVLKNGAPAFSLIMTYIIFTGIVLVVRQWVLHKTLNYNNLKLIKGAFIPSFAVVLLFLPVFLLEVSIHPLLNIFIFTLYLFTLIFIIGLDKTEREYITRIIKK